jgi:hypothetical protein
MRPKVNQSLAGAHVATKLIINAAVDTGRRASRSVLGQYRDEFAAAGA